VKSSGMVRKKRKERRGSGGKKCRSEESRWGRLNLGRRENGVSR